MHRIPIFSTLVVLAAAGLMVGLGFWQLQRLHEKEALLSSYASAQKLPGEVEWPRSKEKQQGFLYRRARLECAVVTGHSSIAGRNAKDESGAAQTADCTLADGTKALVVLGWSRMPMAAGGWAGGEVHGVIAPGPRLVAAPPLAGLEANAIPDPAEIPNNHLSYAVQWFFFAATALVIYVLALAKGRRP
ncbi:MULTISPECIES: SURF1 family protein [Novosphingobium]|uniref:SURF1 family protein n=1 Tax=Novosphingobium sp. ST904 TaxID=1684385 RepID=UPI0006C8B715|nr:SURF1 family protein [Novosphingobium sp. ST904]KPH64398.1 threonine synthase [Novosphingobium sp. ST904]TCM37404.1 surfeit locus 1 family protein [Novosphingobium sp. ST904]